MEEKKIGIIGTGSLGGMLIRAFTGKGAWPKDKILVFNRTPAKAEKYQEDLPGLRLAASPQEVVDQCRWVFLCVKPGDLKDLLAEIGTVFGEDRIIISTLLSPSLKELDRLLQGKIVRVYPSVTQSVGHGVNLVCFGSRLSRADREELLGLINLIGKTFVVPEEHIRPYGDITSCGPAFMSYMVYSLVEEAVEQGVDEKKAEEMALETMLGTALLLREEGSFAGLISRVATPGGCTAEGIRVLQAGLPPVIREVFRVTWEKEQSLNQRITRELES
ncbi:MAG TPA: NAD(P)-binding domain-containing protein [Clostridia bacterium]|nr:NAD(P)-binding domain-containing protein [Clostridia bacterium]